ncbi:aminoglycoside phospho transferase [Mycobacterium tuberculosis]|nr:aminoglycoside phospho transferase [Mycobacterium tuberculosis]
MVERELLDTDDSHVRAALAEQGFADEAGLAAAMRTGELGDRPGPAVIACLRTLVRRRLAVAHPGYDSEKEPAP